MSHKSALTVPLHSRARSARDRSLVQGAGAAKGVEGILRDPDEAQQTCGARTRKIERRARDFEARARNRRETAELWAVRTPGGVESGAPGVRYKKIMIGGALCLMSLTT